MKWTLGLLALLLAVPALAQTPPTYTVTIPIIKNQRGDTVATDKTFIINADGSLATVTGGGGGGGAGDASAANQATQITAAQLTNTTLGAVTASPTANTVGDRLKTLNTTVGTGNSTLGTINTTLGTPFQAGGSIGNTAFGATQSGTWNVTNISGTVSLPTGAATAALQGTTNTSLATINTTLGTPLQAGGNVAVTASALPTGGATSALQTTGNGSLSTIATAVAAATPAGENHIGEVSGRTILAGATFTTPAGTTAYAQNQVIANSATAGSVTPLTFTVCRVNAGTGMLRRIRLKTPDTGFAGVTVTMKLYRDSPTLTNGDHGAWLTTESMYLGAVPITFDQHFSDAEKGIGIPSVGSEINFDCASGVQTIFGLLVAGGAITPQGSKLFTAVAEVLAN